MPDRLVRNLLLFLRQNGRALSKRRREKEFTALTGDEATRIEAGCREVFGDPTPRAG